MTQSQIERYLLKKFEWMIKDDLQEEFEVECAEAAIELTKNKPDHLLNQALVRTWDNRMNEAFGI